MTASGRRVRPRSLALLAAALALLALAAGGASALTGPGDAAAPARVNVRLAGEGRENTTVIVQNNSARAATIVMDFHTPAGVLIPLASRIHADVAPYATRTLEQALNRGLLPGFRGVGVISSDQPLNALLLREVAWPGGDGSHSIRNAHPGAGVRVALPYVANQLREGGGEALNTRFSIANASLETACVTITYQLMPGRGSASANGATTLVASGPDERCPDGGFAIAAAGQLTLAPEAGAMARAMPAGTVNSLMTVLIDSTRPVTVAADVYGGGPRARLASYNGFIAGEEASDEDDVSTRVIMPLAQKTADGRWTEYAIANPWDEAVSGVIRYRGTVAGSDEEVSAEAAFALPAGGGVSHSVFDSAALPVGFTGAATIEAARPVAALLLRGKMTAAGSFAHEAGYAAVNGVPAEQAASVAKFPLVFRNARPGGDAPARDSWISVAVADGGKATLELVAVNSNRSGAPGCESPAFYRTTITIEGSFLFEQGADDARLTGLGATPDCLTGGMRIRSDAPIVAIGGVTSELDYGDGDGLYNAFP